MQFFLNAPLSAKMEGGNPDNRHNKIQQYTGVYTLIMVIAIRIYMSYLRYLTHLTLFLIPDGIQIRLILPVTSAIPNFSI